MYSRKMNPRTTCLYSAAEPHKVSAICHSSVSSVVALGVTSQNGKNRTQEPSEGPLGLTTALSRRTVLLALSS